MGNRTSPHLVVIADDLTGANDAGVQFAMQGVRSLVLADWKLETVPSGYTVVVINSESRHISPHEAAERMERLAKLAFAAGVGCIYKKTDSTLRGNIGIELETLLRVTGAPFIPFIPALPDLGRTTSKGIHYVFGEPIAQTAFARDPLNPVLHSRVRDVLKPHVECPVLECPSNFRDVESLNGIVVLDCERNEDLIKIGQTLAAAGRLQIVAGSVALAKYLPDLLSIESSLTRKVQRGFPILLVNGSVNERSLRQLSRGTENFTKVQLTPEHLLLNTPVDIPASTKNLLLYSISEPADLHRFIQFAAKQAVPASDLHLRIAERTGQIVRQLITDHKFQTLVVFGGDTLAGIARAGSWNAFESLGEIQPGLSLSQPLSSDLLLISKSGGFGDLEVIQRIYEFVESQSKPPQTL